MDDMQAGRDNPREKRDAATIPDSEGERTMKIGRTRRLGAGASFTLMVATSIMAPPARPAEPAIPFADALDEAAISVPRLDGVTDYSLLIGNGDINALVYSDSGNLVLRLTKNDVWDARLDTSDDPPLLPIKRIKELARGDWLKDGSFGGGWLDPDGKPHQGGDSWSRPYPCPVPCGIVRLGDRPSRPSWRRVRAEGTHNGWERQGGAAVMSIEGCPGASNGFRLGPIEFSTDDYTTLTITLSGTENARYFVAIGGPEVSDLFASTWIETPTGSEEKSFGLPAGKQADHLILYTWTEDGKRAENRFEAVSVAGPKGKMDIDVARLEEPTASARLDLRRAAAHVKGTRDGPVGGEIRALAHCNVFLIDTPTTASLGPSRSPAIPSPTVGRRDGVDFIHQVLPNDADWPGMRFAVALAQSGPRKAVAIVTSHESLDEVSEAIRLARVTVRSSRARLVREHEMEWFRFWVASGIDIEDDYLSSLWYRNLYFLRCVSKPGVQCVGLYAGLVHDGLPAWHGGHTTNYNAEQTFWTSFPTNHLELNEPYEQLVSEYLPRARWLCRQLYDCEGAYYPHNLFNFEPAHPELCRSRLGRQQFYVTWLHRPESLAALQVQARPPVPRGSRLPRRPRRRDVLRQLHRPVRGGGGRKGDSGPQRVAGTLGMDAPVRAQSQRRLRRRFCQVHPRGRHRGCDDLGSRPGSRGALPASARSAALLPHDKDRPAHRRGRGRRPADHV